MAKVFERWGRVRAMGSPGGYAYRTAVNLNRKRIRHVAVRARRLLAVSREPAGESEPETRADLSAALRALPRAQREAFMLVTWVGLSAEEAAPILGIRPASVRSRVHRARAGLRERIAERVDDRD
jgi:RNA polymerase sigma-70 factor (ECF subfamily)